MLPGAYQFYSTGSCRGIFGWAPGRCQPMCNPHEMHNYYAQRHSASLTYLWRASSLMKVLLPISFSVFLLVVGCVEFCWYQGREFSVGFALYILLNTMGFIFVISL